MLDSSATVQNPSTPEPPGSRPSTSPRPRFPGPSTRTARRTSKIGSDREAHPKGNQREPCPCTHKTQKTSRPASAQPEPSSKSPKPCPEHNSAYSAVEASANFSARA